jgi:heme/copper-type cytochrome/quinol oxidase subunit 2
MLDSESSRPLPQQMTNALVRTWSIAVKVLCLLAYIGSIGISHDRQQQVYVGMLALIVSGVYLLAYRFVFGYRRHRVDQLNVGARSRALLTAACVGASVNFVAQLAFPKFGSLQVPHGAISAGYQMLLVSLAPMPTFPGDLVYQQMSLRNRVWLLGTMMVLIGFFQVFGLLLPLLFALAEITQSRDNEIEKQTGASAPSDRILILFTTLSVALIYSMH